MHLDLRSQDEGSFAPDVCAWRAPEMPDFETGGNLVLTSQVFSAVWVLVCIPHGHSFLEVQDAELPDAFTMKQNRRICLKRLR